MKTRLGPFNKIELRWHTHTLSTMNFLKGSTLLVSMHNMYQKAPLLAASSSWAWPSTDCFQRPCAVNTFRFNHSHLKSFLFILYRMPERRVNSTDSKGCTALHYACSKGHQKVAEKLLKAKADPSAKYVGCDCTSVIWEYWILKNHPELYS